MLVAALRGVYFALGSSASATLVSLLGVVMVPIGVEVPIRAMEVIGVIVGLLALSALVTASVLLIPETLLVVTVLQERAKKIMARTVAECRYGSRNLAQSVSYGVLMTWVSGCFGFAR